MSERYDTYIYIHAHKDCTYVHVRRVHKSKKKNLLDDLLVKYVHRLVRLKAQVVST